MGLFLMTNPVFRYGKAGFVIGFQSGILSNNAHGYPLLWQTKKEKKGTMENNEKKTPAGLFLKRDIFKARRKEENKKEVKKKRKKKK